MKYSEMTPYEKRECRLAYAIEQDGKCWYCDFPLDGEPSHEVANAKINRQLFPSGMFDYPVHLHHNHTTDETIGAVHARCNAYLWQYHGE